MTTLLNWLASHWASWTVSGIFGFFGGLLAGGFKWFYPSRREWEERRRNKNEEAIDSTILEAMRIGVKEAVGRGGLGSAPGYRLFQAEAIARGLKLDPDTVVDSLRRLERKGRVETVGSRIAGGPPPYWRLRPH